jgi:DNA invertase Pin-like site-specific DNA recombinase
MMAALNGVRTVIVERLDRVARAVLVQELITADLAKREVRLLTSAGDDSAEDSPERVMFRQMLGVFAQYERASIVLKLRGARQRKKAEAGRCEGRKPYGMKQGEVEVLQEIRDLRTNGLSYDAVAEELNRRGLYTRYNQKWLGPSICKILKREQRGSA